MQKLLKKWRSITLGFLIISYLALVVFMHRPLSSWLLVAGLWILLLILVFLGTFFGVLGILLQSLTKRQEPSIPLYRLAYKFGTKNATILASYGLLLLRENKPEEGLRCFQRALEGSGYFLTTKTLLCNKGIALWKLGKVEEALDAYLQAMKQFGKEDQLFFTEQDFTEEGIQDLITSNTYFYPQDYTTMGFLYTLAGKYEEAEFFSRAALAKKENYAAAYDNLGQIDYYQKNPTGAKVHFSKALELNENLPDSLYFSGLIAFEEKDYNQARLYLEKAKSCRLDGLNTISYEMIDEVLAKL